MTSSHTSHLGRKRILSEMEQPLEPPMMNGNGLHEDSLPSTILQTPSTSNPLPSASTNDGEWTTARERFRDQRLTRLMCNQLTTAHSQLLVFRSLHASITEEMTTREIAALSQNQLEYLVEAYRIRLSMLEDRIMTAKILVSDLSQQLREKYLTSDAAWTNLPGLLRNEVTLLLQGCCGL